MDKYTLARIDDDDADKQEYDALNAQRLHLMELMKRPRRQRNETKDALRARLKNVVHRMMRLEVAA